MYAHPSSSQNSPGAQKALIDSLNCGPRRSNAAPMPAGVADRRAGVARAHDVVLGLVDVAERGQALVLADGRQLIAAAGEDLVRIRLMSDVPDDLVARGVQDGVQRDGQLAGAEVGAEVAADLADGVDDVLAHLLRDAGELLLGEAVEILRAVDRVQEARAHE